MAESKRARKKASTRGALRLKQVKSVIGSTRYQREVLYGLGLKRLNQVVELQDTPEIRGMVGKVPHLVRIVE